MFSNFFSKVMPFMR